MQEGISGPLTTASATISRTSSAPASDSWICIESLIELTTLKRGELDVFVEEVDPRRPLREAVASVAAPAPA
jgi:hypothetical protein